MPGRNENDRIEFGGVESLPFELRNQVKLGTQQPHRGYNGGCRSLLPFHSTLWRSVREVCRVVDRGNFGPHWADITESTPVQ